MITWKHTGKPVKANMSYQYEFLQFELKEITRHEVFVINVSEGKQISIPVKVNRLTFEDKTGTRYNTYEKYVEWVLPDNVVPTKNIYHLMNIEESDYTDETYTKAREKAEKELKPTSQQKGILR